MLVLKQPYHARPLDIQTKPSYRFRYVSFLMIHNETRTTKPISRFGHQSQTCEEQVDRDMLDVGLLGNWHVNYRNAKPKNTKTENRPVHEAGFALFCTLFISECSRPLITSRTHELRG